MMAIDCQHTHSFRHFHIRRARHVDYAISHAVSLFSRQKMPRRLSNAFACHAAVADTVTDYCIDFADDIDIDGHFRF